MKRQGQKRSRDECNRSSSETPETPEKDAETRKRMKNWKEQKEIELLATASNPVRPCSSSTEASNNIATPEVAGSSKIVQLETPENDAERRRKNREYQKNWRERKKQKAIELSTASTPVLRCSTSAEANNNVASPEVPGSTKIVLLETPEKDAEE